MIKKNIQKIKTIQNLTYHTVDKQVLPVLKVGQGKPVILLHGFGMSAKAWLPFVLPLADKFCFYLPYLRGFKKANNIQFSQDDFLAEYVSDINAMRDQFGLDSVILGGISMGAMTCMAINAYQGFQGVEKCLFIDQSPVIHNKDDWQWGLMGTYQNIFFESLTAFYKTSADYTDMKFAQLPENIKHQLIQCTAMMLGSSFNNKPMRYWAKLMQTYPSIAYRMRDTSSWQIQRHIILSYLNRDYDFRDSAKKMDVPVTIMIGEESRLYSAEGQRAYASMLPNATVICLEKSGHATLLDSPVQSYKAIKNFLMS